MKCRIKLVKRDGLRLINKDSLISYANNKQYKTITANDIERFPTQDIAPLRWISVQERLPDNPFEIVIALCECTGVYDAGLKELRQAFFERGKWQDCDSYAEIHNVIAWFPICRLDTWNGDPAEVQDSVKDPIDFLQGMVEDLEAKCEQLEACLDERDAKIVELEKRAKSYEDQADSLANRACEMDIELKESKAKIEAYEFVMLAQSGFEPRNIEKVPERVF